MPRSHHKPFSYTTSIVAVRDLPPSLIEHMVRLYLNNFDGSSEALFREDLAAKDEVILLCSDGELVGFTALQKYTSTLDGDAILVVYSGDTIVDRPHWGQQQLARAWIARMGQLKAKAPKCRLCWFLLVKGHRTYKYLSVFGKSFHPHWSEARPDLKRLADKLAAERFGDMYDPGSGIVSFPTSRGHLKPQIAEPSPEEMTKPSTRFFLETNTGFRAGHELVCICELEPSNMKPLAERIFREAMQAGGGR